MGIILLVVDIQPAFYENTDLEEPVTEMINNINGIIEKSDPENIIYIQATGKVLSISGKGIKTTPMNPAPEMDKRLKIVNDNVFVKTEGDAFSLDELKIFLKESGAQKIILVGLLAEKCISATAFGGLENGFDVCVVADALVSKNPDKKEKVLKHFSKKGICTINVEDF